MLSATKEGREFGEILSEKCKSCLSSVLRTGGEYNSKDQCETAMVMRG
jgi:hypothetical protein